MLCAFLFLILFIRLKVLWGSDCVFILKVKISYTIWASVNPHELWTHLDLCIWQTLWPLCIVQTLYNTQGCIVVGSYPRNFDSSDFYLPPVDEIT